MASIPAKSNTEVTHKYANTTRRGRMDIQLQWQSGSLQMLQELTLAIFHFTLLNYFRRSSVRIPTLQPFHASVMKVSRDRKCVQMEIVCFVNNEIVCVQPR